MKLEVETQDVCMSGVHWTVALAKDARDILENESNLLPAHKGCNSSKSGSKKTDSIAPQKKSEACPGAGCELPKAI